MPVTLPSGQTRLDITMTPVYVPPEVAELCGLVTDADTGSPITGVLVEVLGTGLSTYTTPMISVQTGNYWITDIPAGTYTIRFSHADYETLEV